MRAISVRIGVLGRVHEIEWQPWALTGMSDNPTSKFAAAKFRAACYNYSELATEPARGTHVRVPPASEKLHHQAAGDLQKTLAVGNRVK